MKTISLLISLFFLACSGESASKEVTSSAGYSNDALYEMEESEEESIDYQNSVQESSNNVKSVERKLIKKGNIAFETNNLSETRKHIDASVKKFNGYIASDNQSKSSYEISTSITVRLPSENFDVFLAEISSKVDRFDHKSISVNDVTEQFLDVQARLKVKKELENQYLQLLKKAKVMKEILEIQRELTNVRSEIESMEGRLKYLQNQVSFSTLDIRFYKVEIVKSTSKSYWRKLANAFMSGIDNIKLFILGLVHIWPFLLIITLVVLFIRRKLIKRKK